VICTLIRLLHDFLEAHGLFGYVRVFTYVEFRAVMALIISFTIVLLLGKPMAAWLVRQKIKDNPEFHNKTLNDIMRAGNKSNTPTMGGILITGTILFSTLLLADLSTREQGFYVWMALLCMLWLCAVGLVDDWLKLTRARRVPGSRDGLYSWEKLLLQLGLAVLLGIFIHHYGSTKLHPDPEAINRMSHALSLPLLKSWEWSKELRDWVPSRSLIVLGPWAFVALTALVITGSSNAVNLTDGMDGLASGVMCIVGSAFAVLALLAGWENGSVAKFLLIPYIPNSDELAIVAAAMVGACAGFLWFNANPALMFMGDTGSLPLGGLIGFIAVVIRQEFLLLIIGGVFVAEAVSVILQVGYFKLTKNSPGGPRRLFKCAPIHHHFHMSGLPENQIVVRAWLISAVLAAIALVTIKLR
jgi:phospho-N-acetylmuramoyl-pentapeptide-transferase